jgi:hypothetical protein
LGKVAVWADGVGSRKTGLMLVAAGRHDSGGGWNARAYDPVSDRWQTMAMTGSPGRRGYAIALWTGELLLVWGPAASSDGVPPAAGGARYEP